MVRAVSPVIVRVPSAPAKRSKGRRIGHAIGAAASEEKHRIAAVLTGAILGWLDAQGTKIPTVPMLGRAGTVGVVAYLIHRQSKGNRMLSHIATGALTIAAYELANKGTISGDETMGDDPTV
jgi:hypothetical protein